MEVGQAAQRIRCRIHGEWYDLTDFVSAHPGGRVPLLLVDGTDATEMFEMYHPLTERHRHMLRALRLDPADEPPEPGSLQQALQRCVRQYLDDHQLDGKATWLRSAHYVAVFLAYVGCLVGLWSGSWMALIGAVITGWFMIGLGHDAAHFAVSRRPWVNRLASLALLSNTNLLIWYYHHTLGHHVRTNRADDPDLHIAYPFMRSSNLQPHRSWHRWQRLAIPVYFCLSTCWMTFTGPLHWLWRGRAVGVIELQQRGWWLGVASWCLSVAAFVVMPLLLLPLWKALLFSGLYIGLSGLLFSLHVQVSHMSEHCFPVEDEPDWARHQIRTTMNWRAGNRLVCWLSNGVSHQIEHHLFPGINPMHYAALSPLVQQVCREHGVPYHTLDSHTAIVVEMWRWLGRVSKPEVSAPEVSRLGDAVLSGDSAVDRDEPLYR